MKITNKKDLEEAIIELEKRKVIQHALMIQQYHQTTESLQPGNLVKGLFNSISHSAGAKSGIIKTIAGIGFGLLTKKLFWGKSDSLIKKWAGNALKIGVAKTAISNSDKIKAYAVAIYHNLIKKNKAAKKQNS